MDVSKKNIVFVANRGYALKSSREKLIKYFLGKNYNVVIAASDDEYSQSLVKLGAELECIKFFRGGINLFSEIKSILKLFLIYKKYQPSMVHHFHAKPVIFGTFIARFLLSDKVKILNTITGLGYSFSKKGFMQKLALLAYSLSFKKADRIIFQNRDDMELFIDKGILSKDKCRLIVSSGVDFGAIGVVSKRQKSKSIDILMAGRLLKQKGLMEFIEAAHMLKSKYTSVNFKIAGEFDPVHPDSISRKELRDIENHEFVEFIGYETKFLDLLKKIDIFVFPSYYREGVPRVVLEAAASGLPVIGANVPGTREAIIHGKTGILVSPKDSGALADAIEELVNDIEKRISMGNRAFNFIKDNFSIEKITEKYLNVYKELGL